MRYFNYDLFHPQMDHPCYKCGQSVEDGKAFCSPCGAPQIRVAIADVALPAADAATLTDFSPFTHPANVPRESFPFSSALQWPVALRTCAISAFIAALAMVLGLMVPLLAALGAGVLAVNFYHRRNPAWLVTSRSGALLGAVCGAMFFSMAAVFETIAVAVMHSGNQVREKMVEALQQAATRSGDPQVQEAFARLITPEGIALMLVVSVILLLVVSIAAGSLAGALTGAFIGRKKRI